MRSELTETRPTRKARRDSSITSALLIIALLLIQESNSRRAPGALRDPLLHGGMLVIVTSFTYQAIGAWRAGARWPDRIMPAAFALGIAIMELGALPPLHPCSVVLTDVGMTALLAGAVALGADIVMMFRSPWLKS